MPDQPTDKPFPPSLILDGIPDGITAQDTTGRLVYANDAAARLTGYPTAEALLAAPGEEVLSKFEILDEHGMLLPLGSLPGRRAFQSKVTEAATLRFRIVATGEERWAVVKSTPMLDEHQEVRMVVNLFQEISDYMRVEHTQRFLAQAGALLSRSLDYETTLAAVARLAVPHLADWCSVDIVEEDGEARQLALAHVDPEKIAWARRLREQYPPKPDEPRGVANVLRTGRAEFYPEISDSILIATAQDQEHLEVLRQVGLKSVIIVPLVARDRVLGALTFVSAESGRRYGKGDLALAEDLAKRAAMAVDNARLYREAQEAVVAREEALRHRSELLEREKLARKELKSAIAALRLSEARLRRLVDSNIVGVALADLTGNFLDGNDAFLKMIGYTRKELKGGKVRWADMTPSEYAEIDKRSIHEVRTLGVSAPCEKEFFRKDGSRVPVLIGSALLDEGEQETCIAFIVDLTERKRTENILRASEERFSKAFNANPDPMSIQSMTDGRYIDVNDSFLQITGYSREEVIGHKVQELNLAANQGDILVLAGLLKRGELIHNKEVSFKTKHGEIRWGLLSVEHIEIEGEQCLLTVTSDITDRKRLEVQISRALEDAEQANKLKDEFLANLSHELRTPLSPIIGWARILERNPEDTRIISQALPIIIRNAKAQIRLVEDLLDMSRIITGKMRLEIKDVNLADIIKSAIETVRFSAEARNVSLEMSIEQDPPHVAGDVNRLQQIFWNLLSNAIKFTPDGGRVTISLRRVGNNAEACVSDNGIGINPNLLQAVFERFRQADEVSGRQHGGLGLGLAIVRSLVELHGGTISAHSEGRNRGSQFIVSLPLAGMRPSEPPWIRGSTPETTTRKPSESDPA